MLSPPLPWSSYKCGGYLVSNVSLVRLPAYACKQRLRLADTPPQQLYPALDSLNALGTIPWRINNAILDLVIEIFNSNGSKELDIPQPPSALSAPPSVAVVADGSHKVRAYRGQFSIVKIIIDRCQNFMLSISQIESPINEGKLRCIVCGVMPFIAYHLLTISEIRFSGYHITWTLGFTLNANFKLLIVV